MPRFSLNVHRLSVFLLQSWCFNHFSYFSKHWQENGIQSVHLHQSPHLCLRKCTQQTIEDSRHVRWGSMVLKFSLLLKNIFSSTEYLSAVLCWNRWKQPLMLSGIWKSMNTLQLFKPWDLNPTNVVKYHTQSNFFIMDYCPKLLWPSKVN